MADGASYRKIWSIAYPIILGSAIQNVIRITDTAFLGRVGEIELGAAGIGSVFYMTFMMLGMGYGVGAQILVARRYGQQRISEIGKTVEHAFYFLLIFAFVIIGGLNFSLPQIFNSLVSSENIQAATLDFLYIRIWGLLFAFTNFTFRGFYIGIGQTKVITVTTAMMALVNVFLDYVMIFGKLGFPEMGIQGAALASVIAEMAAMLTFIYYSHNKIDYKKFRLFKFQSLDPALFGKVFNISLPVMLQNFLSFAGWMFFFLFVEKLGERALAVSNIIRSIYVIMLVPIMGYSFAANSLVSYVIGKGEPKEATKVTRKAINLCLGSVAIMVIIILLFPMHILSVFTDNQELITATKPVLYVISGTSFFIGSGFVLFNTVSGTGNTKAAFLIEAAVFVIYVIVTYYLAVVLQSSIEAVWAVEFLYGGLIAGSSFLFLKYYPWQKKFI
ncbi:MAG: MATE family efflux transporter [Bacteroidales bacterium]